MALSIQSHTFGETHELTIVRRSSNGRIHYRTNDGRDVLAKPTSNPACRQGHMYWTTNYGPDIAHFLNGDWA